MPVLNDVSNLMVGASQVSAVYAGSDLVWPPAPSSGTESFSYTGAYQEFVVPDGVTVIQVEVFGASGGDEYAPVGNVGQGGRVRCDVDVTPGETLRVYVGGVGGNGTSGVSGAAGWNGGGPGGRAAGGGGGATDIRRAPYALADRLVIGGGGGGSGANNGQLSTGGGGYGGVPAGLTAQNGVSGPTGGGGASQSAGGLPGSSMTGTSATAGTLGQGGSGGVGSNPRGGGGGGGGFYGGGGGGGGTTGDGGGGGGGGSGYSTGAHELLADDVHTGSGEAYIRWGEDIVVEYVEDGWYSYDYNGGSGTDNVFYQAVETAGPVFSMDDSGWRVDPPEDPDSVLAILRYQQWGGTPEAPTTTTGNAINLLGATISFELRGTGLDLKGGHATFWVVKAGQRWHYTADFPVIAEGVWTPFEVTIDASPSGSDWHNSWAVDPVTLSGTLASVHSYGIGFVGFSSEPTGQLDMRKWRTDTG